MENGKQSEWKAGQNAKDGEKNHFALETVSVRIYNVLGTAIAEAKPKAEQMQDRCPSEGNRRAVRRSRSRVASGPMYLALRSRRQSRCKTDARAKPEPSRVRTNVLVTAIAEAKPKAELTILKQKG